MPELIERNKKIDTQAYLQASKTLRRIPGQVARETNHVKWLQFFERAKKEIVIRRAVRDEVRDTMLAEITGNQKQEQVRAYLSETRYQSIRETVQEVRKKSYEEGEPSNKKALRMAVSVLARTSQPSFFYREKHKEQLLRLAGYEKETNKNINTSWWLTVGQTVGNEIAQDLFGGGAAFAFPIFDTHFALTMIALSTLTMLVNTGINYYLQRKIKKTDSFLYTTSHVIADWILNESRFKQLKVFMLAGLSDTGIGIGSNIIQLSSILLFQTPQASSFIAGKQIVDIGSRTIKMLIKGVWGMTPEIKEAWKHFNHGRQNHES